MREKLLKLMETEHLTASRLAELLGIRSSGISHILAGRNKPSFDMLQKILRRFPNINPDWLLLDGDQMYRSQQQTHDNGIFEESHTLPEDTENSSSTVLPLENSAATEIGDSPSANDLKKIIGDSSRKVKRVIVLFADHTFESYEMK